jgi:hypothetical protein
MQRTTRGGKETHILSLHQLMYACKPTDPHLPRLTTTQGPLQPTHNPRQVLPCYSGHPVQFRVDAEDDSSPTCATRLRLQARFKPILKAAKEEKANEKISRAQMDKAPPTAKNSWRSSSTDPSIRRRPAASALNGRQTLVGSAALPQDRDLQDQEERTVTTALTASPSNPTTCLSEVQTYSTAKTRSNSRFGGQIRHHAQVFSDDRMP